MSEPITTTDVVKARAPVTLGPNDDQTLQDLIAAVSIAMEREIGCVLTEGSLTEVFDGDTDPVGRYRHVLTLSSPPIKTNPAPVITEDGVALVVGSAYDATGATGVYVSAKTGRLTKPAGWFPGLRNISVVYTGAVGLPTPDLVSVAVEAVWLTWRLAAKEGGIQSVSMAGATFQAMRELSPLSRSTLARYRWRELL